jgi:class 3 adenylate cyclase
MSQTRRLAAILVADVAGYSRLMGGDEEGTHEGLQAHLREFVNLKTAEHRGGSLRTPATACLPSSPAWSMPSGAPLRSSAGWPSAMREPCQRGELTSASASTSVT